MTTLNSAFESAKQRQEKRHANKRCQDAQRQLGRRHHSARHAVSQQHQGGTQHGRPRQHDPMIGTCDQTNAMRRDQPDKTNDAGSGRNSTHRHCRHQHRDALYPFHVDAEQGRLRLTQRNRNLLAAVAAYRFKFNSKVFTVGVSIGLSTVTGESTSADVLSTADTACYWAKEQGRHRVCVYRATDRDMASRRRETGWIARINLALAEDRFVLYHQTYLALDDAADKCEHLEVLIRLIDEDGRLIQPGSFLPAAERYNLMPTIDRWVVSTVMAGYHTLVTARGGAALTCAINLSGTSINSEGFLDFVRGLALKHSLPKRAICFEITETAAVNSLRKAAEFILECKHLGFLFALDDFGTGTSSFGYLKNLPVDYLKIDGGFVKNLEHDAVDKAMTETINRIGHIMGIKTIAEYAENSAIIEELRVMGVDYAQGYGVCLPSPLFDASSQLPLQGALSG